MAQKYGMTKSGLVTFLINQADDKGTIFKKKSPARKIARARKIWFSFDFATQVYQIFPCFPSRVTRKV